MKKLKLKKLNEDLFKKSKIKMEQAVNIKGGGFTNTIYGKNTDYASN